MTYIKLDKGKLSRNGNDEKNCGSNHSQKSSFREMDIRTMIGYKTLCKIDIGCKICIGGE